MTRDLARRLRYRRLSALGMLLLVCGTFSVVIFSNDADDPDGLLRIAWLFGALMVTGTLGFGLSLWVLNCPACGHRFGSSVSGSFDLEGKSVVAAIVALLRPFSCPSCGLHERERAE